MTMIFAHLDFNLCNYLMTLLFGTVSNLEPKRMQLTIVSPQGRLRLLHDLSSSQLVQRVVLAAALHAYKMPMLMYEFQL